MSRTLLPPLVDWSNRAAMAEGDIASGSGSQQAGFTITLKNGPSVQIAGPAASPPECGHSPKV
jgi:hypothetical protein